MCFNELKLFKLCKCWDWNRDKIQNKYVAVIWKNRWRRWGHHAKQQLPNIRRGSDVAISICHGYVHFYRKPNEQDVLSDVKTYERVKLIIWKCLYPGEAWQEIMMALSPNEDERPGKPPGCIKSEISNAADNDEKVCASRLAYPYFISFSLLCTFLVSLFPMSWNWPRDKGGTVKYQPMTTQRPCRAAKLNRLKYSRSTICLSSGEFIVNEVTLVKIYWYYFRMSPNNDERPKEPLSCIVWNIQRHRQWREGLLSVEFRCFLTRNSGSAVNDVRPVEQGCFVTQ